MRKPVIDPLVCIITEGDATADNFSLQRNRILELLEQAASYDIPLFQLREKRLSAKLVFELASEAVELTARSRTRLLVNDRADIALAAGAAGVHLTESSLSAAVVRKTFPKDFLIGASTHSLESALAAKRAGADFVTYSPVFDSPGKSAPKGLRKLREICDALEDFPVLALGGVDRSNFESVLASGAGGFAAIRFLNNPEMLEFLAEKFEFNCRNQQRKNERSK